MNKLTSYLKKSNSELELSYLEIRRSVGVLGIALPIAVSVGTWVLGSCPHLKDSISDYYYTLMGNVFVGILCGVGLFLYSYRGFDHWDRLCSNMAGLFALGVAFFPMNVEASCVPCNVCNILTRDVATWRGLVHYGSAGLLFITLACMSLFLFTKTSPDEKPTKKKLQRNMVYRTCGIIMLACICVIAGLQVPAISNILAIPHRIFWLESIMLWAFGFSWLIKGQTLLKD